MSSKRHPGPTGRKKPKPETAIDRRAARTRAALHKALIGLILRHDYDAISVGDIVAEADIGRSTFYTHFTDKDDLVRDAADRLRQMLVEHQRAQSESGEAEERPFGFSRFMFEHTREQLRLYRALTKGRAGTIILASLRRVLADFIRDDLKTLDDAAPIRAVPPEAAVQFIVGGFMSMLTWWLDRGAKEPPEEMDAAFRALVLGGV